MSEWNASNYRERKALRLAKLTLEWVVNPETGEKFYLRRVGAMAAMIAGQMPSGLTAETIAAWGEKGVEGATSGEAQLTTKQLDEAQRDLKLIAQVVGQACVIPKLTNNPTADDELDPAELDDKDLMFIFRWATGQVGAVIPLKGGDAMTVENLKRVPKRPGRRIRTGDNRSQLQQVS